MMLKHVEDIECENVDWISLAHDRVQCRVLPNMTVELHVIQMARSYWLRFLMMSDITLETC
jgi:hypothetical protein